MEKLDSRQEFVFRKIRQGLESEEIGRPMKKTDRERLLSRSSIQQDVPASEWDNWSRRIHHALQVAFLDDTDNVSDVDALDEWRRKVVDVVDDAFQRVSFEKEELLVLEDAATHFVKNDLFRYLKKSEKRLNLSEKEERVAKALEIPVSIGGSGCLGSVLAVLVVFAGALLN